MVLPDRSTSRRISRDVRRMYTQDQIKALVRRWQASRVRAEALAHKRLDMDHRARTVCIEPGDARPTKARKSKTSKAIRQRGGAYRRCERPNNNDRR